MSPLLRPALLARVPRALPRPFPPVILTQDAHPHRHPRALSATPRPVTQPLHHRQNPLGAASSLRPGTAIDPVVSLAARWASLPHRPALASQLAADHSAVSFVMKFVDWVMRPENPSVAARFLKKLVSTESTPAFLSSLDRALVALGGVFAPLLPNISITAARARMRAMVTPFVGTVENLNLNDGVQKNVNLLGEAVLGDKEALHRRQEAEALLEREGVTYVSVKVSGVTSQLNRWDHEGSLDRVLASLRPLFRKAATSNPQVLINLDMEEYHDLEITVDAFTRLLQEPEFQDVDAGIVLQTYLPDALPTLQRLVTWANNRPGTGQIKIRLVKGANLAMEKVDAEIHGWRQTTYTSKSDTDANYLRCLDWVFQQDNLSRVRIGVASHNLFLLAYAKLLAEERGVTERVGFENLRGMTPSHTPALAEQGHGMLLYTPVCRRRDFDSAISYLFRRFEEASSDGNFLRSVPTLYPGSPAYRVEESRFRTAAAKRHIVPIGPRRVQERPARGSHLSTESLIAKGEFINEPDSDPCLPNVREWAVGLTERARFNPVSEQSWVNSMTDMSAVLARARQGAALWSETTTPAERRAILHKTADVMARRRGELINAMLFDASKTIAESDPEVSEAIDFANYYALQAQELPLNFESMGVVVVAAPWNFPVAIGGGGAFAALASGNAAILKPSPNAPRCAELLVECAWEAGVPRDVLQFVQCPENEVGKHLITEADAVILTGSSETADLFRSWKKDMRLFAETSGKNSLVISPAADLDLAVADLVQSAFSSSGQKCSASSLAICIGDVYTSERFRRQLKDAAESLKVGPVWDVSTVMGPLIEPPGEKLLRALTTLDDGEEWLVQPKCLDADGEGRLWTPGVRMGVRAGSWFHKTEAFGPVLGLMHARDLDEALELQNGNAFGLTGGIHSLDNTEIDAWTEGVQVGNAYVNRGITGAIVSRQCFGGWKESCVGPGAKAGGPNYIAQFGTVRDESIRNADWLAVAAMSDEVEWEREFSIKKDAVGLVCESNDFRYRALPAIGVRVCKDADEFEVERVRAAVLRCGVERVEWSNANDEEAGKFGERLKTLGVERVRVIGKTEGELVSSAAAGGVYVVDAPVVANGRVELLHYLREQSISRTRHRFGNFVAA